MIHIIGEGMSQILCSIVGSSVMLLSQSHTSSSLKRALDIVLLSCGMEALAWLGFDFATEANRSYKVKTLIIIMYSLQNEPEKILANSVKKEKSSHLFFLIVK